VFKDNKLVTGSAYSSNVGTKLTVTVSYTKPDAHSPTLITSNQVTISAAANLVIPKPSAGGLTTILYANTRPTSTKPDG